MPLDAVRHILLAAAAVSFGVSCIPAGSSGADNGVLVGNEVALVLNDDLDYYLVVEAALVDEVVCYFGERHGFETSVVDCEQVSCGETWESPVAFRIVVDSAWRDTVAPGDEIIVFFPRETLPSLAAARGGTGRIFASLSHINPSATAYSSCELTDTFFAESVYSISSEKSEQYYQYVRNSLDEVEPTHNVGLAPHFIECFRSREPVFFEPLEDDQCTCPDASPFLPDAITLPVDWDSCPEHLR
jgi:hypothetical protein